MDLDRLEALATAAPAEPHIFETVDADGWRTGARFEGQEFYDAMKAHARALIAAARERDALRAALDAYQVALVETMQRATNGYDWNADPDHITRLQGAASAAAEAACEALFQALAKETPNA